MKEKTRTWEREEVMKGRAAERFPLFHFSSFPLWAVEKP